MWHPVTLVLGLFLLVGGIVEAFNPMPCCTINYLEPNDGPSIFSVSNLYIDDPNSCHGRALGKIRHYPPSQTTHREVCANGFNLMAFVATLIQDMGGLASREETVLLASILKTFHRFSINNSIN